MLFIVVQLTANDTCFTVIQTQSMIVDNVQPTSVTSYLYYDPRESHVAVAYCPVGIKIHFSMAPVKQLFLSHGIQTYVGRPLCLASVLFDIQTLISPRRPRQKYIGNLVLG